MRSSSSKASKPGKKSVQLADIVENSDSEDLPSTSKSKFRPKPKPTLKRKIKEEDVEVEVRQDSSNEELSHAQKKQRALSPWPVSPKPSKRDKHLVNDDSAKQAADSKRVSKPSEKIVYMANAEEPDDESLSDDAKASSRKDKKAVIRRRISKKKYIEIVDNSNDSDSDNVATSKRVETHDQQVDDEPPTPKVLFKGKKVEVLSEEQIDEEPKTPSKGKKYRDSHVFDEEPKGLKTPADGGKLKKAPFSDKPSRSAKLYPQEMDVPADSDYDNQAEVEPVITDLMPLEKQDPKLRADYINLPELPYKEMQSFFKGPHATEEYSLVWGALETELDQYVLRRVSTYGFDCFATFLPFVNPSRAPLSTVQREADRVVLANAGFKKQSAVFLTTGVILLCPFGVEYERAGAFIGGALDIDNYVGQLSDGNLVFVTRGENFVGGTGFTGVTSPGSTPPKNNRGRKVINFKKPPPLSFPSTLNFTDEVPIYDVRGNSEFAFTADDLANLSRLPLYEQGRSDLPPETLATVGYTVGCYLYRAGNSAWHGYTVISLNVLFVLALGNLNRGKLEFLSEQM
ncbi:hypothetical protein F5887DRAFT_1078363 [Amanita rubescens]|nr:hypothetical protein F5887DRAFT_1078363 [Amanita rubescens]